MPEIPYTVRLAPKLLERIEKTARERAISPAQTDSRGARRALRRRWSPSFSTDRSTNQTSTASLDQILFDLTRTRLTLQHLLDHQVGSEATDQIRQTSQQEAERYMHRLRRRTI